MRIKTVTVIGVTGTMGANIAGIFASFGEAKVYCVGRSIERVEKTIPRIVKSVKADSIIGNLIPADYEMLEKCVSESDFVFESVSENLSLKAEIATRIGRCMNDDTISCTGSSGLSISTLAECYPENCRKRFFGVHMFNPPYNMTLCELISTRYSDSRVKDDLKEYLKKKLLRTVVEVEDSPAFLGNRIGFWFINEALILAEQYKDNGGIDYIDAILGTFTGRAMPPLMTADFVGLDIHKAIVDNIYRLTNDYEHDSFLLPQYVQELIENGKLGNKTGSGLYQSIKYDNGVGRYTVYDIKAGIYRDAIPYAFPFAEEMKKSIADGDYQEALSILIDNHSQEARICLSFLLKYILYSLYSAGLVCNSIESADDVMATGFNWCPPIAMYQAFSKVTDFSTLCRDNVPDIYNKIDDQQILEMVRISKYDYRPYFKSGR